jgi:hypothetical protein
MHLEPLPKTSVEILAYLTSKIRESFTVRQIAAGIGRDYRITYIMTMRLAKQKYIIAEKRRPVTYCRLSLKGNSALLAHIEAIRAGRFLAKHRDIEVVVSSLTEKITSPFFTLMLFGSHVKGTASKRSDLDVLFVIQSKDMEKEVSLAVGSVSRVSPIGLHEVILTGEEFVQLLKQKSPNVAWEAVDSRIVPYGAESFFKILEAIV